jgi:hypothetical protein
MDMLIIGDYRHCCVCLSLFRPFSTFGFGVQWRVYRLLSGPKLVPCLDANLCSFVRPPVPSEFAFA